MTYIPEDIQQAARDVVHDYPSIVRQCVPDIERALLRERERCAQIALTMFIGGLPSGAGQVIASAIRTPSQIGVQ